MKITVDVDETKLANEMARYIEGALASAPYSGSRGGFAYEAAKEAAKQAVLAIDFGPLVKRAIDSHLGNTVAEVVVAEIKKQAAVQAKLMLMPKT